MKIELLDGTTEFPLSCIGERAGICWNSPTDDVEKNVKRAQECILSGHGRVMEYVSVEFVVSEISARMARELYTHIGGSPSRLQSSTRYVDASNFEYYKPGKIADNKEASGFYDIVMKKIADAYSDLLRMGVAKEDAANILPLGMHTKVVLKCNLRMLENLMNMRLCSRALLEIRQFATELKKQLAQKNAEWKWVADTLFVPKCEKTGFCNEKFTCGRKPKKA